MEKALIIQNKFIGDVLASSLIAKNLKQLFKGKVEVHFFCYDKAIGILENNPNIDKIISFDDKELKKLSELWKMVKYIRSEKYSIIIDPYAKLQSRIITLFSNAKIKSSFDKPFFKYFYSHVYPEKNIPEFYDCTAFENRLSLLNPFNLKKEKLITQTEIFLKDSELIHAKNQLQNELIFNKPILMLGVLGSSRHKSWPLPYMSKLIEFLLANYDYNILLNYVPNQEADIQEILQNIPKNKKLFSKPLGNSIREMASILSFCKLFIGNEGGGINLAKALNIPTFSIYSPHKFREDWGCYEQTNFHRSVHLKDLHPEIYMNYTLKEIEAQTESNYLKLDYHFVQSKIVDFLNYFNPIKNN